MLLAAIEMKDNELGFQNYTTYTTRSNSRSRFFLIFVVIMVVLAAILAGLFMLGSSQKKAVAPVPRQVLEATATPLPTSSASATLTRGLSGTLAPTSGVTSIDKTTKLDRSALGIAVLNGSGVAGAAQKVSDYLEGLGYKIVQVGNADVYTYKNLNVIVKKSKSRYADLLRKDLRANPDFASVSAAVSDDIANDAEVIVGE